MLYPRVGKIINILMERGKVGIKRWERRERIDSFILVVVIVYIILMSYM